jgi:hypothetical protein
MQFNNEIEYFDHVRTQQQLPKESRAAKPVVKYVPLNADYKPVVGLSYSMVPVDHPAGYLNGQICESSRVIAVDATGFETLNTRYELEAQNA